MDDCAEVNRHNTVMFFNSQIYKIQVFKFLKISIIQLIKKSVLLEKFKKAKNGRIQTIAPKYGRGRYGSNYY